MKKVFIVGFLLFLLTAATKGPVQLREGYVVKVDSPETVNVVDRNGKSFIMKPAKDRQFVALHMSLLDYRSLGKYDYILEGIDKKWTSKCLLIGINNEAYSQLNWEFRAPGKISCIGQASRLLARRVVALSLRDRRLDFCLMLVLSKQRPV